MSDTILLAVNDSPAAFTAVDAAVDQARRLGARLCAVMVIEESEMDRHLDETEPLARRRELAAEAVLNHVLTVATRAGVEVTARRRNGRVAAEILAEAHEVHATMIVMARVDRPGHAMPFIGSHTLRVLEFARVPVLVVPEG
ncbi:universal stress protein [Cryobacterium sp. PH31-AA6]|uniref:universal stress protein n=1 Tax=Cryobacterium sp. PH31-AA6 TaxID=3046205 RepID=UPI0024B87EE3|nr:universal stress protein [Cryobacterium sp. PH31-AA6]MDJ0322699.1 universal stress protein [Cryobacterium sp. PH31-AA6]